MRSLAVAPRYAKFEKAWHIVLIIITVEMTGSYDIHALRYANKRMYAGTS